MERRCEGIWGKGVDIATYSYYSIIHFYLQIHFTYEKLKWVDEMKTLNAGPLLVHSISAAGEQNIRFGQGRIFLYSCW